jgi:SAM-dependent methyltransferase
VTLRDAWEAEAANWVEWARRAGHDSYGRFHRDAFLALLPPPGRRTLDVGCGEGRLARDLKALGHRVVAVDASPTMVAAVLEADPSIETHVADAAALPLADASADLVVAFMSLQDVDDMPRAVAEAARVLDRGGRLCLAIVHPLNSAGKFVDDEPGSPFVLSGSYLRSFRYGDTIERDGLVMTFESEHRPLEAYFEALAAAGFLVERLREPPVPDAAVRSPRDVRWQRTPLFLHLRAVLAQ